ncbi:hypothetical protein Rsub_09994 [Raphidocelis subcapitata]|uniref:Uncharacterized protein n=1 Tax=Raphidocelis subcapitata TaxID=307507 RepID=A0A2V0PHB4_9CHLO|nr:hypothetical protein Rsub_09994 [Raphidocelis subcapitata]|eukprot:GBF97303.1 hypothetical protein Rsub_09994 [Raphidocelis subcapitata]
MGAKGVSNEPAIPLSHAAPGGAVKDADGGRGTGSSGAAGARCCPWAGRTEMDAAYRELAEAMADNGPPEREAWWLKALRKAGGYVSFGPMILAGALDDLRYATLAAVCLAVANFAASLLLYRLRVYRIWPKTFDLVNIAIYAIATAIAWAQPAGVRLWMPVLTSGGTAGYFVGSLLGGRPFSLELAKESAPKEFWDSVAFWRLNFWISLWWAAALSIAAVSALVFGVIYNVAGPSKVAYLVLDVVLGIAPLVVALVAQHAHVHAFSRRVRREAEAAVAARRGAGAAAA